MHYDVAIIGAGLSGLAAAARIAHFGKKVVILEKHTVHGGLNSFYKKGGHPIDTGLHALTNWVRPGYKGPRIPLQRVARQLRFDIDELELQPQTFSEIAVGGDRVTFTNDLAHLEAQIAGMFPREMDGFRRLVARATEYPEFSTDTPFVSTRGVLRELIREHRLRELLLAPAFFYGSASENDLDFEQYRILFSSIFLEGFSRPRRGVRQILDLLLRRLDEREGELRRGTGVARIEVDGGRVARLVLEDGDAVTADAIISTAGLVETARLRSDGAWARVAPAAGRLAFVETIWVLDRLPKTLGHEACVTFFSTEDRLFWEEPEAAVDLRSGVICCPTNYTNGEQIPSPMVRATHLARPGMWFSFEPNAYRDEKARWAALSRAAIERQIGPFGGHVIFEDSFTPKTVHRYTAKENGAIYGSPSKSKTGATDLSNLFLAGTDQGLLGIVGAMLSGIAVANKWVLGGAS